MTAIVDRSPEVTYQADGQAVAKFSLFSAAGRGAYADLSGPIESWEVKERSHEIVVRGRLRKYAESISRKAGASV